MEIAWADNTDEPYSRLRKKVRARHKRGGASGQRRVKGISNKHTRLQKVWRLREEHPDMPATKFVEEVLTGKLELSVSQAWRPYTLEACHRSRFGRILPPGLSAAR